MLVGVNHPGREPVTKQVPLPLITSVERLRVPPVQAVETRRQPHSRRFDDQVVMRAHEAERVDAPPEAHAHLREEADEVPAIVVAGEKPALVDCATRDVINAVGEVVTERSRHQR